MRRTALLLLPFATLAACQSSRAPVARAPAPQPTVVAQAPQPVDRRSELNGRWVPSAAAQRGVYYAQFRNGSFVSKDPDSGADLARGTYRVSGNRVFITYETASNRGTATNLSCSLAGGSTMNCTGGRAPFALQRA